MKLMVEKVFDVWEKRIHIEHDTPCNGAYVENEIPGSKKRLMSSSRRFFAEKYRRSLIKKYLDQGWRNTTRSSKEGVVLMDNGASDDICIWIEERIVSEKPITSNIARFL